MKHKAMWIILLFLIAWCGITGAEQDTLEKLREGDWDIWLGEGGYDLALMGDDAAPFLVDVLTDESEDARWHARYFLDRYYADLSVLPKLKELFVNSEDNSVRKSAAYLISTVDAEYARKLMVQYMNDLERQDIAENVLTYLRDESVIPKLIAKYNDPNVDPFIREHTAYTLADFRQKNVVPYLIETYNDLKYQWEEKERVAEKLASTRDVRALPILLNYLSPQSRLSDKIITAFSQSDPSIVQPLLEKVGHSESTYSSNMQSAIYEILGNQTDPAFIPIYEKTLLEIDDTNLQAAISGALGNMGEQGFESLVRIVQEKPNACVLRALATYNTDTAIATVMPFTFDKSFPYRKETIKALFQYAGLWEDKISHHITKLLTDVSPKEKLLIIEHLLELGDSWEPEIYKHLTQLLVDTEGEATILTIDLIRRKDLAVMAPALENLIQKAKGRTLHAAQMVYDILHDRPPLELIIEMDQERYDYLQPITLTYRITNVSDYPIYIALYTSLSARYIKLKIQQPDGTMAKYRGPHARLIGLTYDDIQTLQPGDEITGTIQTIKSYDLFQSGLYTVELEIFPGLRGFITKEVNLPINNKSSSFRQFRAGLLTWSNTLTSPKVFFQIDSIPNEIFKDMIESIDPEIITEENREEIVKTCYQLAEFGKQEAIAAIKKLALMDATSSDDFRYHIKHSAQHFLFKFPNPELMSTWIEEFNIGYNIHARIEALGASGDARAIEPLRRITLNNSNYSTKAALALQKLGDECGVKWLRKIAFRKLRHYKEDERRSGAGILASLESPDKHTFYPLLSLRNPQFYEDNYELYLNWEFIHGNAASIDGLKELLIHEHFIVRHAAAYELAYRGDKTGIELIQQDLQANESATRIHARDTLSNLKK